MKIAIASDHTGYIYLQMLSSYLESLGHQVQNFGPKSLDPLDDYPDFIRPAAEAVSRGLCEKAIIFGGSGQGEAMAANRFQNVRCAVFYGPAVAHEAIDIEGNQSHDPYEIVRLTRKHNDSNVLSIGARFTTTQEVRFIVKLWLETRFLEDERHARRNTKLDKN